MAKVSNLELDVQLVLKRAFVKIIYTNKFTR